MRAGFGGGRKDSELRGGGRRCVCLWLRKVVATNRMCTMHGCCGCLPRYLSAKVPSGVMGDSKMGRPAPSGQRLFASADRGRKRRKQKPVGRPLATVYQPRPNCQRIALRTPPNVSARGLSLQASSSNAPKPGKSGPGRTSHWWPSIHPIEGPNRCAPLAGLPRGVSLVVAHRIACGADYCRPAARSHARSRSSGPQYTSFVLGRLGR